jgi:hypothetical protein
VGMGASQERSIEGALREGALQVGTALWAVRLLIRYAGTSLFVLCAGGGCGSGEGGAGGVFVAPRLPRGVTARRRRGGATAQPGSRRRRRDAQTAGGGTALGVPLQPWMARDLATVVALGEAHAARVTAATGRSSPAAAAASGAATALAKLFRAYACLAEGRRWPEQNGGGVRVVAAAPPGRDAELAAHQAAALRQLVANSLPRLKRLGAAQSHAAARCARGRA